MNRITLIALTFIFYLVQNSAAQTKHEGGLFAGTSWYMGDLNPTRLFYSPSPAFGAIYKRSLNPRELIRLSMNYGGLSGTGKDYENQNQQFSARLLDLNACYEFNFLPIHFDPRKLSITTFLFGGLGYEFALGGNAGNHFTIPFGIGTKYLLSKKVTVGAEWSFRKTFIDNIDGVINPGSGKDKSALSNTDWYSFAGFFITFRLFDHSGDCPVYQ